MTHEQKDPKWTVLYNIVSAESATYVGTGWEFFDDEREAKACYERHIASGNCPAKRRYSPIPDFQHLGAAHQWGRTPPTSRPASPIPASEAEREAAFKVWWTTPNHATARAPCTFMDLNSARAAFFAARAASTRTASDTRTAALEEAAAACEAWGNAKVAKWADDPEMCEDAKARAWDALQCAAAIRALSRATASAAGEAECDAALGRAAPALLTPERIKQLWHASGCAVSVDTAEMKFHFARSIEQELASRCGAQGRITQAETRMDTGSCGGAHVDVEAERKLYLRNFPSFLPGYWTERQECEFSVWLAARAQANKGDEDGR